MPFDDTLPDAEQDAGRRRQRRQVARWLYVVAALLLDMVVIGGLTRLTGSGLSIMEWAPVSGILPPLTHAQWVQMFDLYKTIPQYALLHQGFGLDGFRRIFWLEWIHRFWGRLLGAAFLVPLAWFVWRRAIERRMLPWLGLLFVLGALQGVIGWLMVASGFFPDTTAVAPSRLVVHLTLAVVLYGAILWTGMTVERPVPAAMPGSRGTRRLALASVVLLSLTIVAGSFVAGTHAGLIYNSFPLMDGRLVPASYAALHPFALNLVQNLAAVQFDHRVLAVLTTLAVLATASAAWRGSQPVEVRRGASWMAALVLVQFALGVATLLLVVPIWLAAVHQLVAVLLLSANLVLLHRLRGAVQPRRVPYMPRAIQETQA